MLLHYRRTPSLWRKWATMHHSLPSSVLCCAAYQDLHITPLSGHTQQVTPHGCQTASMSTWCTRCSGAPATSQVVNPRSAPRSPNISTHLHPPLVSPAAGIRKQRDTGRWSAGRKIMQLGGVASQTVCGVWWGPAELHACGHDQASSPPWTVCRRCQKVWCVAC